MDQYNHDKSVFLLTFNNHLYNCPASDFRTSNSRTFSKTYTCLLVFYELSARKIQVTNLFNVSKQCNYPRFSTVSMSLKH